MTSRQYATYFPIFNAAADSLAQIFSTQIAASRISPEEMISHESNSHNKSAIKVRQFIIGLCDAARLAMSDTIYFHMIFYISSATFQDIRVSTFTLGRPFNLHYII